MNQLLTMRPGGMVGLFLMAAALRLGTTRTAAVELPPGFGTEVTAVERRLAERPEPWEGFLWMTGQWHGAPGWPALRERWLEFGKNSPAFAVLAALLLESEGNPEQALAELQALPGPDARWNQGRLLAVLGPEQEAVRVLAALAADPACPPDRAAEAVLALTELDCIKNGFPAALARSTAAWEGRREEAFRMRLLERHLSLLLEAGGGNAESFLKEIVSRSGNASATRDERSAARRLMALMAEWMPGDARLVKAATELAPAMSPRRQRWGMGLTDLYPEELPPGLEPTAEESLRLARQEGSSRVVAEKAALTLRTRGSWPESLDDLPALRRFFDDEPAPALRAMFPATGESGPLPPLFRHLVSGLKPGSMRLALELTDRAWSGNPEPRPVEALSRVIVESRPVWDPDTCLPWWGKWTFRSSSPRFDGRAPSRWVLWNQRGAGFVSYYRMRCRLSPVFNETFLETFRTQPKPPASNWREWRPGFPRLESNAVVAWAWRELDNAGMATPSRAAHIAGRMRDDVARVTFGCIARQPELLMEWLQAPGLVRRLPSPVVMMVCRILQDNNKETANNSGNAAGKSFAVLSACGEEMRRRLQLDPVDFQRAHLIRGNEWQATGAMLEEWREKPVNAALASVAGGWSGDTEWEAARTAAVRDALPHPLSGLRICPSVDLTRRLAWLLSPSRKNYKFHENLNYELLRQLLGQDDEPPQGGGWRLYSKYREALDEFPTDNPVKRQALRWMALTAPETKKRRSAGQSPFPFRGTKEAKAFDTVMDGLMRTLASEERNSLPWALVAASLEKDPMALGALRRRSPVTADVPLKDPEAMIPLPPPDTGGDPVENLLVTVRRLLRDPVERAQLERSGAVGLLSSEFEPPTSLGITFARVFFGRDQEKAQQAAEALLGIQDPVAARIAATLGTGLGETRRREVLLRALKAFPDDPDLLMARACETVPEDDPALRQATFVRALQAMKSLTPLHLRFSNASPALWCGRREPEVFLNAESAAAIAAFVRRSGPAELPPSWSAALNK